jgi:endonuclease III
LARLLRKTEINEVFNHFASENPAPITELVAPNEFCLLVAIVLSAQATDVGVNKSTIGLFAAAETPQKMLDLGEDGIKAHIKTIGLFNAKAKNIIKLCTTLLHDYDGVIPESRDELQKLAGVGRKTANVWLNCTRGALLMAVDTHVFRTGNRIGLCKAANVAQCELQLERNIPAQFMQYAHHWLILHGRYVCKARKPECSSCIIASICQFPNKAIPKSS